MFKWRWAEWRGGQRRARKALLPAAALALMVALALPARAADDRAVKTRVAPVYPEIAKRLRITGEVKLEVIVDAQGKVKDVKPISGNRMLETAAEDAVRQWRFESGTGDATEVVAVNFTINQ